MGCPLVLTLPSNVKIPTSQPSEDGSVTTWGDPNFGGDSSAVQDQLTNVQQIKGSGVKFLLVGKTVSPFFGATFPKRFHD